jgi:hypothetical protein
MRKVAELTSADFPGIDSLKFEQWKQSVVNANRNLGYLMLAFLAIIAILYLAFDIFAIPGFLVIILAQWLIFRESGRLFKELGLTSKALIEARRRAGPSAP